MASKRNGYAISEILMRIDDDGTWLAEANLDGSSAGPIQVEVENLTITSIGGLPVRGCLHGAGTDPMDVSDNPWSWSEDDRLRLYHQRTAEGLSDHEARAEAWPETTKQEATDGQ